VWERHYLRACSWAAEIWKTRCWWLTGCVFTKPPNHGQKQTLPHASQGFLPRFLGRGLMMSAGEKHQLQVLQLPMPSVNVFPCPCSTHCPSNCADTDMLRKRSGNSLASKKPRTTIEKHPNPVVCFLNPALLPIIVQGVTPTKAVSAQGRGWQEDRSCWAGTPKARTALSQEKDTQNCNPSAAALLHFEIKLKH